MKKAAQRAGYEAFTMVELLIVVSIITIASAAAIPGFSGYIRSQNLKQSMERVKSDLRTAQIRAMSGSYSVDDEVFYWGIDFREDQSIYIFNTYDSSFENPIFRSESEELLADIVVRSSDMIIFFENHSGDAYSSSGDPCDSNGTNCTIILGAENLSGDRCSSVIINSAGGIFKEEGVSCP